MFKLIEIYYIYLIINILIYYKIPTLCNKKT